MPNLEVDLASKTKEAVVIVPLKAILENAVSCIAIDECWRHSLTVSAKQTIKKLEC